MYSSLLDEILHAPIHGQSQHAKMIYFQFRDLYKYIFYVSYIYRNLLFYPLVQKGLLYLGNMQVPSGHWFQTFWSGILFSPVFFYSTIFTFFGIENMVISFCFYKDYISLYFPVLAVLDPIPMLCEAIPMIRCQWLLHCNIKALFHYFQFHP